MKKFLSIFFVFLAVQLASRAGYFFPTNRPVVILDDMASWNLGYTAYSGDYIMNAISTANPKFTNFVYDWGQSGGNWLSDAQNNQQMRTLPILFMSPYPTYNLIIAGDNGGFTSNQVYSAGLILNASTVYQMYDGVSLTNLGVTYSPTTNLFPGAFVHNSYPSADLQGVNKAGDDASTNLQNLVNIVLGSTWHMCVTNGFQWDVTNNRYLFFPDESPLGPDSSHFSAAGGYVNMVQVLRQLNYPTNVSSFTLDWNALACYTNGCSAVNFSRSNNVVRFDFVADRLAPWVDANGGYTIGALTNDARYAFLDTNNTVGMAIRQMFCITNGPAGTYTWYMNGAYCDTGSDADWATNGIGRNWATNFNPESPMNIQRSNSLAWVRYSKGADPATLNAPDLGAGHVPYIPGSIDQTVYQSHVKKYQSTGLRGLAYLSDTSGGYTVTNDVRLMDPYFYAMYTNNLPQTFSVSIVLTPSGAVPAQKFKIRKW